MSIGSRAKIAIRSVALRLAPGPVQTLQAIRARRLIARLQQLKGIDRIAREYVRRYGTRVQGGPFAGMQYSSRTTWGCLIPKLLGVYESELAGALMELVRRPYNVVVDIGCADGYYAIGLARALPQANVFAFDPDPLARQMTSQRAVENNVRGRVVVGGRCTPRRLEQILTAPALIISDCEGYEDTLLDPGGIPALRRADLIVEFHEDAVPGETDRIVQRFASSHSVQLIDAMPRDFVSSPMLEFLSEDDQRLALNEFRNANQQWGIFLAETVSPTSS